MRIATGEFWHETHTFSRTLTTLDDFRQRGLLEGQAMLDARRGTRTSMGGFMDAAQELGFELIPTLSAGVTPSGTIARTAFDWIEDRLLAQFQACGPIDGILLSLHGAMVTQGLDDAEGHILQRLRRVYGRTIPIVATLDLHANISAAMVTLADVLDGYDTYPHVDPYDRAVEAGKIIVDIISGHIKPTAAISKPPILAVPQAQYTDISPLRDLLARAHDMERDPRVVNVTVAGGFPYSDIPKAGMSFVVSTNDNAGLAETYAEELGQMAWGMRDLCVVRNTPVAEAVRRAMAVSRGTVILADVADNIGGGSPGDGTVLLDALLKAGVQDAVVVIADAESVDRAIQAGIGALVSLKVGAKADDWHGKPVPVTGRVRLISDGIYTNKGTYMTGQVVRMGRTCVLSCDGVTLALTEYKTPPFDAQQLRSLGIEPADQRIIVTKSAIAWKAAFGDVAAETIYVDTPGLCTTDLSTLPYGHICRPIFPLDSISAWSGTT
jgi:microcystin degradation protein MlrC